MISAASIEEMEDFCRVKNATWHREDRITDVNRWMDDANELCDGNGWESIRLDGDVYPVALYVNMGDSYDATIVYIVDEDVFCVASTGDLSEEKGW